MKCVCPMGGDRACPDDCLLAVWANMPPDDRKTQRKSIAEKLYKQNFTMEQIATQLGVSRTNDLSRLDFVMMSKLKIVKPSAAQEARPPQGQQTANRK